MSVRNIFADESTIFTPSERTPMARTANSH